MKFLLLTIAIILFSIKNKAQNDSVFERITKSIKEYKLDTSNVPNDKTTKKIVELQALKGGFNINEAIEFKIQEEISKNESSKEDLLKIRENFKHGLAKKWLDNAIIWIYRQEFSYPELKQLVKFYKTPAGQKMARDFPLVMLKSLTAAEMIRNVITKK